MAYDAGDILVTVRGSFDPGEIWANVWAFVEVSPGSNPQDAVDGLHAFYAELAALWFPGEYHAISASVKDLATGISVDGEWEALAGSQADDILPTQLAVRVSLSDDIGTRGGPFLGGWNKATAAEDGLVDNGAQAAVITALNNLDTAVTTDGYRIGIHRPTVPDVRVATMGRVGKRFDVIRKRGNNVPEAYASTSLI